MSTANAVIRQPDRDQAHDGPPRMIAGRYRVGEEIGRGGRAVVHAATDVLLRREVAIKLFFADAGRATELRVQENEARLAAAMNHHALTTLFDAGVAITDSGSPQVYLVMERIPGQDLRQRLSRDGALSSGQVACLGLDLAEALRVVHEHGFLHRDIKPANVLIADRDLTTRIRGKLADFGIASTIGTADPADETIGTAAYLSPEQVEGRSPTTASDVYSLGLVLLEALTGRVEFSGTVEQSAFARLDRDPVIPETAPAPIVDVLRRMTNRDPARRPELPEVMVGFLTAYVQHLFEIGRVAQTLLVPEESRRLAAVRDYRILDTPADDAFDRIVRVACRLLDVPIALLAIVDAERAWFKATRGAHLESVDRNIALCARTVSTGEPTLRVDVQADPSSKEHPMVQADPTLRAFAAVALRDGQGNVIGTLSIFDRQPRTFTPAEIADLDDCAALAVRELDIRQAARRAAFAQDEGRRTTHQG